MSHELEVLREENHWLLVDIDRQGQENADLAA